MGDDEYWSGGTFVYHGTIENGGGGGGSVNWKLSPGVGNELELLYGLITNGDTVSRSTQGRLRNDGGDTLVDILENSSQSAATSRSIIDALGAVARVGDGRRLIVSGDMDIFLNASSLAAGQDATIALVCRFRGGVPTVTEVGNSTPVITVNTEKVY